MKKKRIQKSEKYTLKKREVNNKNRFCLNLQITYCRSKKEVNWSLEINGILNVKNMFSLHLCIYQKMYNLWNLTFKGKWKEKKLLQTFQFYKLIREHGQHTHYCCFPGN